MKHFLCTYSAGSAESLSADGHHCCAQKNKVRVKNGCHIRLTQCFSGVSGHHVGKGTQLHRDEVHKIRWCCPKQHSADAGEVKVHLPSQRSKTSFVVWRSLNGMFFYHAGVFFQRYKLLPCLIKSSGRDSNDHYARTAVKD